MSSGYQVVGLVSGGKDSCYAMMRAVAHGHRIVALANLHPPVAGPGWWWWYCSCLGFLHLCSVRVLVLLAWSVAS
jgi:hypothetical protein